MRLTTRAAATAAVLGAGLVTASLHGHGAVPAAAVSAALSAPQTYQPPKVALAAPVEKVRVLPASAAHAAARPEVHVTPRTTHATAKRAPAHRTVTKPKPVHHVA